MDDSLNSGSENKLPLFIGLGAIAVAVLALAFAIKARGDSKELQTKLSALTDSVAAAQSDIGTAKANAAKASEIAAGAGGELEAYKSTVQASFNALATTVNEHSKVLQGIAKKPAAATTGGTAGTAAAGATAAGPGEYAIKGGDTFAKIARANGTTIAALEAANPGVKSSSLKVGQKIKLPAKK